MKNTTLIATLLTVLISTGFHSVQAEDGPSFDCTKASNWPARSFVPARLLV